MVNALLFGVILAGSAAVTSLVQAQGTPDADTIVAVVDEKPITLGELIVLRQTLPTSFQDLPDEVLLESLIKMVVDQQILANAAEAADLQRSKRATYALKNKSREVLADVYVRESVTSAITEDLIAKTYQDQYAGSDQTQQVRAAHILVEDKGLAEDLRKKLDEGMDFATLAAEFGTDLTSSRGGDLGWQDADVLLPALAEVLLAMEPGQIAGPVRTPFGWHLVRLDETRSKPVPSLEDVRADIIVGLQTGLRKAAIETAEETATIRVLSDSVPAAAIRDDSLIGP